PLPTRPLGLARRLPLLCPRLAMTQHGHVRVPAAHRAERQRRARAVTGRHVADPVRAREGDLLLAVAAALPERDLRPHRCPPRARVAYSAARAQPSRGAHGRVPTTPSVEAGPRDGRPPRLSTPPCAAPLLLAWLRAACALRRDSTHPAGSR